MCNCVGVGRANTSAHRRSGYGHRSMSAKESRGSARKSPSRETRRSTKPDQDMESASDQQPRPGLPRARSIERQDRRRERAQAAPARLARSFVQLPQRVSPAILIFVALMVIFLALSIAQPLRNYFDQRSQLAQLEQQIDAQEQERDRLTGELNRFNNEDYIKEQARTRLGLIEPGESAFRIFSPKIDANSSGSTPGVETDVPEEPGEWYQQLWDAISTPEEEKPTGDHVVDHNLPTVPDPDAPNSAPDSSPEDAPAPDSAPDGQPAPAPENTPEG